MRETWYVLKDGTAVHPSEVSLNDKGQLAHKTGLVAMRDDGETPRSRGVDVDDKTGKPVTAAAKEKLDGGTPAGDKPPVVHSKDLKAEKPKRGYRTREIKA